MFSQDPLNGEQGRRFRRIVLENREHKHELECLKEFLGREPNNNALAQALSAKKEVVEDELTKFVDSFSRMSVSESIELRSRMGKHEKNWLVVRLLCKSFQQSFQRWLLRQFREGLEAGEAKIQLPAFQRWKYQQLKKYIYLFL